MAPLPGTRGELRQREVAHVVEVCVKGVADQVQLLAAQDSVIRDHAPGPASPQEDRNHRLLGAYVQTPGAPDVDLPKQLPRQRDVALLTPWAPQAWRELEQVVPLGVERLRRLDRLAI